jgi:hypothetical protein
MTGTVIGSTMRAVLPEIRTRPDQVKSHRVSAGRPVWTAPCQTSPVASDNSITRQTISARWNPERRDIAALIRLAGVPRSFLLFFTALWAIGMLLSIGWQALRGGPFA